MKKTLLAVLMVVAIVITCTACGEIDMNKIKGDWTVSTINGTPIADVAANAGMDLAAATGNMTINEDGTLTLTSALATQTYKYTRGSNGIESKDDAGNVVLSFVYDDAAKTLTMTMSDGTNTVTTAYTKGTADLTVTEAAPAEDAADEEAPAEDAATAELAGTAEAE